MAGKKNLLNVTVSGPDRPGVLAALVEILVKHKVEIADIKQASLERLLGLYLLLDLGDSSESGEGLIKDLLFKAKQLDLNLNFQRLLRNDVRPVVSEQNLFVVTHAF